MRRLLVLITAIGFTAPAFAATLSKVSPCIGLVSPTEPEIRLLEISEVEAVPLLNAHEVIKALESRKLGQIEEMLATHGIPVKRKFLSMDGKSAEGIVLDLRSESPDPMMRAIARLKKSWDQKSPGDFPTIRFAPLELMGDNEGFFLKERNEIWMRMGNLSEYLRTGDMPGVLKHELRHAGFERFRSRNDLIGLRYLDGRFITDAGQLATYKGYDKYISVEESYTFIRDLRKRLADARSLMNHLANVSTSGALAIRAESVGKKWEGVVSKFHGSRMNYTGLLKEAESFKKALSKESTVVTIPLGFDRAKATLQRDGVAYVYDVDCPGCAWQIFGRRGKAESVIREALRDTQSKLKSSAKALEDMVPLEAHGKALAEKLAQTTDQAEVTVLIGELSKTVDEMLRQTVAIIQSSKPKL